MEPLLIAGIIIGAVVLFVVLSQQGNQQQAYAIPALSGGLLGMIAFFGLPWIRLPIAGDVLSPIMRNITGWMIATDIPLASDYLRVVLYFTLACFVLALLGGVLGLIGHDVAKLVGNIQVVVSLIAAVLLGFSLNDIRTLGLELDPTLSDMLLDLVGIGAGIGVWIAFLGLVLAGAGGLFLNSEDSGKRRVSSSHRSRTKRRKR
jgi:hypothetical protein